MVASRNPQTGKTEFKKVLATKIRHAPVVVTLHLADAKTAQEVEQITCTPEHPFFVQGQGFTPAGRLAIGNAIVTRAGPDLIVKSVEWQQRKEGYTVYNFTVEEDHTYFVGLADGGAWVHNTCPLFPSTPEDMDQMLGFEGERIPDGPSTPGRSKVQWQLSDDMKLTYEQHPYHPSAPSWHQGPHFHLDTPFATHVRYLPGDPFPGNVVSP